MKTSSSKLRDLEKYGYFTLKLLDNQELDKMRNIILNRINHHAKKYSLNYSSWDKLLNEYDKDSKNLHGDISPKLIRTLSPLELSSFFSKTLTNKLQALIGKFCISDEEDFGYPEVYWRIIRPNMKSDIGPMHADSWFWDNNKSWTTPHNFFARTKVWISIETEPNKNGLLIIPGSHKSNDYEYHLERKDGKIKPIISQEPSEKEMKLIESLPGDAIIFHDNLLHGGAINKADTLRISAEFTCFHN